MPIATSHTESTTFAINGKILVVGGVLTGGQKNATNAARVYDPATNRWTMLTTPYPKRIQGATAGYWNGRIYATNGYSPDNDDCTAAWWGTVSGI
jgi:N-acetylneuraminic acid mutarotase